jgi:NTE family protein
VSCLRSTFERWVQDVSTPERPVTFHFVEVSFDLVRDDSERDFLNSIGTNFSLSDKQFDRLIAAAGQVLRESKDFQVLIKSVQGDN